MTLDEAIKHAEEVAEEQDKLCKRYDDASGYTRSHNEDIRSTNAIRCLECAEEHRQLAEWLKDYKRLLEQQPSDTVSRGAFEQVMWERDVAIGQLKELGYGLGQKVETCEDAINREELLKAIDTWDKFGYTETGCFVREPKNDYVKYIHYDDAIKCIKGMPSVTPQPKTGYLISRNSFLLQYRCSECGREIEKYDFCPYCGAKMQESEDKE